MVSAFRMPPIAQGASTSHGSWRMVAGATRAPVEAASALALPASMSATPTLAPASRSSPTSAPPTPPAPWTTTVRPARSGLPKTWATAARMPWKTPTAVSGPVFGAAGAHRPAIGEAGPLGDDVHVMVVSVDVRRGHERCQ